jgi:hypothetical protein
MSRWVRFLFAILIGAGLGLAYGWLVSPVKYVDTSPDSLRIDYKTDYVLMVAEAYDAEGDLNLAARRLALLGDQPPLDLMTQSIRFGREQGYSESDLARMQSLRDALQSAGFSTGGEPTRQAP